MTGSGVIRQLGGLNGRYTIANPPELVRFSTFSTLKVRRTLAPAKSDLATPRKEGGLAAAFFEILALALEI
jgi:hypothetical protein